jgi:hypothetical protein
VGASGARASKDARSRSALHPALAPAGAAPPPVSISSLDDAAEVAVERALELIRARHESGRVPDHMYYHNSAHTAAVVRRAEAIARAMDMPERHVLLTVIAAAYHDVVQRWAAAEMGDGIVLRRRLAGRDEVASAHEAVEAMAELGIDFSSEEMGIVASAIVATIPAWDGPSRTVAQPFLVHHPVVTAVAIADLGAAGMEPDTFALDGPALFAEENLDLMAAVMAAGRAADIEESQQERFRSRYVEWLALQPDFARGRRQRMEEHELQGLESGVRDRVLALFSRFDESVALAEDAAARARELDFTSLMRQLDPRAFPGDPA